MTAKPEESAVTEEAFAALVAAVERLKQRIADQDVLIAAMVLRAAEEATTPLLAVLAMRERDLNSYTLN